MNKSLAAVLVVQLLALVGAVGLLASRSLAHPPPKAHATERPPVAHPTEAHPPDAHPAEVHPSETKLSDGPAEAETEWHHFPDAGAAPAEERRAQPAPSFEALVGELVAGNGRFVEGVMRQYDAAARRAALAGGERASAVVVTCTDSRVVPELLFDQPLGTFSVLRLPGAQLDEAGVRAVEEAVQRLHAPAVLLLGHLDCHHLHAPSGSGRPGSLKAALAGLDDASAAKASVSFTARELRRKSKRLAGSAEVTVLRVVYAPASGKVEWLDAEPEPEPAPAHRAGRR